MGYDVEEGCVYGCRHPIWGGQGTCTSGTAGPDDFECSCGDGYISTDSLGRPSCVLERALVASYVAVGLFTASTFCFLLWSIAKQRRMSTAAQASRRATLRLRFIHSFSAYSGSASVIFFVAAAYGNLYGSGMLHALYCVSMPACTMSVADMLDVWVDTLPSQLLPADSVAIKVMQLAEKKRVFTWAGRVSLVVVAALGLSAFFGLRVATAVRCIDVITAASAACAVCGFHFVGFHLTSIISKAKRQASPSAIAFYDHAVKTLWIQVVALSTCGILWIIAVVILQPRVGGAGARTPMVLLSIMIADSCVGFSLAVHFAIVAPARGAPASTRPASTKTRAAYSRAPRTIMSELGTDIQRHVKITATKVRNHELLSASSAPRGNRVVPATGGGEC